MGKRPNLVREINIFSKKIHRFIHLQMWEEYEHYGAKARSAIKLPDELAACDALRAIGKEMREV